MCMPCGPRYNSRSTVHFYRPTFDSVEKYLEYLDEHPVNTLGYFPLPVTLQNTANFVKVVSKHPEVYPKVPKKYQNKAVKAAAGVTE